MFLDLFRCFLSFTAHSGYTVDTMHLINTLIYKSEDLATLATPNSKDAILSYSWVGSEVTFEVLGSSNWRASNLKSPQKERSGMLALNRRSERRSPTGFGCSVSDVHDVWDGTNNHIRTASNNSYSIIELLEIWRRRKAAQHLYPIVERRRHISTCPV